MEAAKKARTEHVQALEMKKISLLMEKRYCRSERWASPDFDPRPASALEKHVEMVSKCACLAEYSHD